MSAHIHNIETRLERFERRLSKENGTGCWEWTGSFPPNKPYGQFYWGIVDGAEKQVFAHRSAWLIFVGEIPEGLQIRHRCNNPKCCNPQHMRLGTFVDNMIDKREADTAAKGVTHYLFKRHQDLVAQVATLRARGTKIMDICAALEIGRSTYYRCVDPARYA